MSRRSEAHRSQQADKMIEEPWTEIPYFFTEYWGSFTTAVCVNPAMSQEIETALTRRIELDGSYFVYRHLQSEDAIDLTGWLTQLLPTVWGPMADIARISLMLRVSSSTICLPDGAQRNVVARRFPCPILFHFEPDDDWRRWSTQHRYLLGNLVELYPAQNGQEELAVL